MRGGRLIPLCGLAALVLASGLLYHWAGAWRKMADRRLITGIKIRQLSAIAENLTRIIMATETESAILNRDINRFLKLIQNQVAIMKVSNSSKTHQQTRS